MHELDDLLHEYDLARAHSELLVADLDDVEVAWRPHEQSSAIAWHLGHQAATAHHLVRNLIAAEPRLHPHLEQLFDSATPEPGRGELPRRDELLAYRAAVAEVVHRRIGAVERGDVGAPAQLRIVAGTVLTALVNHEYQHDTWVDEVRVALGHRPVGAPASDRVVDVEGYWVLA